MSNAAANKAKALARKAREDVEVTQAYDKALTEHAIALEALEESWGEAEGLELAEAEAALNKAKEAYNAMLMDAEKEAEWKAFWSAAEARGEI